MITLRNLTIVRFDQIFKHTPSGVTFNVVAVDLIDSVEDKNGRNFKVKVLSNQNNKPLAIEPEILHESLEGSEMWINNSIESWSKSHLISIGFKNILVTADTLVLVE